MIPIFTIQGFTEDLEYETGTELLYKSVIRKHSSPTVTTLWPLPWDCDTRGLAAFALRQGFSRAIIVGYSWGAGYAAQKLAGELWNRGIAVQLMLLCDPVYRPLWLPAWLGSFPLAIRALGNSAKVTIPPNVRRVEWVRQSRTLPRGHDLRAMDPRRTQIGAGQFLMHSHSRIDQAPEWFSLVDANLTTALADN